MKRLVGIVAALALVAALSVGAAASPWDLGDLLGWLGSGDGQYSTQGIIRPKGIW